MKLTTPKSILISSLLIALAIVFRVDENISLVSEAKAEVAGMDSWDLQNDYDFKKAVGYIVENCDLNGGYVEDDKMVYGAHISC